MQPAKSSYQPSHSAATHSAPTINHIGAIFRKYGEEYIKQYQPSAHIIKLIRSIRVCKSPALGGKSIVCKDCHEEHNIYFSCGNSQCPICQSIKREQWVDKLKNELLNVPYVHMIFTLPSELKSIARCNKEEIYSLILRASWMTVKQLSADPKNIGALPGMIAVLHTFGSDMKYHIHTHCLVTFGGLDKNNNWVYPKRKNKIAKYREINSEFKKIFLLGLKELYNKNKISYHLNYDQIEAQVLNKNWVVHNTKPTIDTSILENYLARYINRIAISNSKVEYLKEQAKVKLIYNDYKNQEEGKAAPKESKILDPLLFIYLFLQHILPRYFQKSRRYGLHASPTKKKIADKLPEAVKRNNQTIRTLFQIINQLILDNPYQCTKCQSTAYEIKPIKADKIWIHKYLHLTIQPRAPTIKSNKSCVIF